MFVNFMLSLVEMADVSKAIDAGVPWTIVGVAVHNVRDSHAFLRADDGTVCSARVPVSAEFQTENSRCPCFLLDFGLPKIALRALRAREGWGDLSLGGNVYSKLLFWRDLPKRLEDCPPHTV